MTHVADRVREKTTTTGTGTLDLDGTIPGFQSFVVGIGSGRRCFYTIEDGTDWEVGIGTVTDASPDTLSRDEILASSTGGSAINWTAGTRRVFSTPSADLVQSSLPRRAIKSTGDMSSGFSTGDSPVTMFTVTGDVLILSASGVVVSPVTDTGVPTVQLGVAGATDLFLGVTLSGGGHLDEIGEVWIDDAGNRNVLKLQSERGWVIGNGSDILFTISGNDITGGELVFYVYWIPLSSDGDVAAA